VPGAGHLFIAHPAAGRQQAIAAPPRQQAIGAAAAGKAGMTTAAAIERNTIKPIERRIPKRP
jgi:hypothetical protein